MLHVTERDIRKGLGSTSSLRMSDITTEASRLAAFDHHERIWLGRDEARGLTAIVAIHSTRLGPALGGTRIWEHASFDAALTDALRLSRGMTLKAAVAGLPLGGGKAVIIGDSRKHKTIAMLEAYAEMLSLLVGDYITAEDVGMTLADADFLRDRTPNVAGTSRGGSGNPSPVTAEGVFLGLRATWAHASRSSGLSGVRVAVQGLGAVGFALAERLSKAGAGLVVSDIDAERCGRARAELGAQVVSPEAIVAADADILAPCALGGVISQTTIPAIRAKVVAGSANNQLARHGDARRLRERGILYAPDYVINAGGLMNVAAELAPGGYDREKAMAMVRHIPETLEEIFRRSDAEGRPTNDVAQEMAEERLAGAAKSARSA